MKEIRYFDILIILMCVVAAFLFKEKIFAANGTYDVKKSTGKVQIGFEVPYLEKEISEHLKVDSKVFDVSTGKVLGRLVDFQINDVNLDLFTFNGQTLEFDKDKYVSVSLKIDTEGVKSQNGILIENKNYLVGQSNTISVGLIKFSNLRISELNFN